MKMPCAATARLQRTGVGYKPERGQGVASVAQEQPTRRLIQACKDGDRVAWNALSRRYQPLVYRFAYSLCHNRDEAEDIVSDVLVRLYRNLTIE